MTPNPVRRAVAAASAAVCAVSVGLIGPVTPAGAAADDYLILAGDQRNHRILALDPAVADWNSAGAVKWEWAPTAARGFSAAEVQGFVGGNDFRLRNTPAGRRVVLVDGGGLVAVVAYPSGNRVWAVRETDSAAQGRHSAELLPNGNVAVAASDGRNVRVYAASQGAGATAYGSFPLPGAHATWWDPEIDRLWVAGDLEKNVAGSSAWVGLLTALEVSGPASAPTLREDVGRRKELGSLWAHDVAGHSHDPAKLWVTTNSRTYLYDKNTGQLAPGGAAWDRPFVKGVGNQPSGQVVETMIDVRKSPQGACYRDNTANYRNWCTDTVDFFGPDMRRTRTGAAFYKARVMSPYYGAVDESLRGKVWDRARGTAGDWAGTTAARIDGNPAVGEVAATATRDGRMHVVTLLPGSGLWLRTRQPDGTWDVSATRLDANGAISDVAITSDTAGDLHVLALIPGSGVWYRKRTAGDWADHARQIDTNGDITAVAAAAVPTGNTVHAFGLVPGSGIWHRSGTAGGAWDASARQIDTSGTIADVSAAALADGTLHVVTVTPWGGVYHRVRTSAAVWQSSAPVPIHAGTGRVTGVAAAGWPGPALELTTVRSGLGLWQQTRTGGAWSQPVGADVSPGALRAYAGQLPDGSLHVGKVSELS